MSLKDKIRKAVPLDAVKKPHVIIKARAGCLAGDTIINVNRAKKGSEMTIENVVKQFSGEGILRTRIWNTKNGQRTSVERAKRWDLSVPTYVARADSGVIKLGVLKNAWCSGRKETFTVTTNTGRSIRASAIHPFMTEGGIWLKLCELQVGMSVCVNVGRSNKGLSTKKNYAYCDVVYHPNKVSNGGSRFKVAKHRLVVEANMNGITLEEFLETLRTRPRRSQTLKYLSRTQIVHHKDEDHTNNSLENLKVVESQAEHNLHHDFTNHVLEQIGLEEIVCIQSNGIEETYDLEMEDEPHNFLANGFVVHNTGKTFSLMGGLAWAFRKRCPALWKQFKWQKGYKAGSETEEECIADVEPSTQQLAIWQQMQDGIGSVRTVRYNAFSSSVVAAFKKEYHYFPKELASVGVKMDFMTIHGFGFRAVIKSHGKGVKPNKYLDYGLALGLFEDAQVTDDLKPSLAFTVYNIADSVKQWLIPTDIEDEQDKSEVWRLFDDLCDHFSEDIDPQFKGIVYDKALELLELSKQYRDREQISFTDMIWLPLVCGIPLEKSDLVLVDEVQDLNPCQQSLILTSSNRLVVAGDDKQAIFGFSGADVNSMQNFTKQLLGCRQGAVELPLTVTRRCPKIIVEMAKKFVPDFEAHPDNKDGVHVVVQRNDAANFLGYLRAGDMVLCRVNSPLLYYALQLMDRGVMAAVVDSQTRDRLLSKISQCGGIGLQGLWVNIRQHYQEKINKEDQKPKPNRQKIESLLDEMELFDNFIGRLNQDPEYESSIESLKNLIKVLFSDNPPHNAVKFMTIHKAKGLENERVFLLGGRRYRIPHKRATKDWEIEQEYNLLYIAMTRTLNEYHYVDLP